MNKSNTPLTLAAALVLAVISSAGPRAEPARRPSSPSAPGPLDWIAGHWCQRQGNRLVEELWLPAAGGLLIGMGRTVADGHARSFEYLRIDATGGKPVLIAQPDGTPPTSFQLADAGADWARFENPAHDFPKVVEYRRTARGLRAGISAPAQGGERRVLFDYLPCEAGR